MMTGRVRIAVVDSGINGGHSHVRGIAGAVSFRQIDDDKIEIGNDATDTIGHGTCIAAVIRKKAPEADIHSVKIFWEELRADVPRLLAAIRWSVENRMDIVNLSLGTRRDAYREELDSLCRKADEKGILIVSAAGGDGEFPQYPAQFDSVIGVAGDECCREDDVIFAGRQGAKICASPYPLSIEGIPRERNFRGNSIATAHVTGYLANMFADRTCGINDIRKILTAQHLPDVQIVD
ncbi:MAG: hypothetical protein A2Z34_09635 [Planctomycetes bacterium RBG_16_59_8]|nr:MAG: hypothetical protein A2Z34_09635 [Planctomycetes bacterium RBG_16_59_8]